MITFYCSNIDTIAVDTKCHTAYTNRYGVVIELDTNMRDCDGGYGIGYVVQWENGNKSFITQTDVTQFYNDRIQFVKESDNA